MPAFESALFASEAEIRQVGAALETLLREGEADEAAQRLEWALDALAELDHPIVPLCRALPVSAIIVEGWDQLAYRLAALDKPGKPVTAIGIDLSWPGHVGLIPDEEGRLDPHIETNFYSDAAFPFSTSGREELLAAYGTYGTPWQGGFEDIDSTIAFAGMEHVQGAAYGLDLRCRSNPVDETLTPADHDAKFVGMTFVAVRIHQAVREMVLSHGLPRPLTVMVGSNESYPFFDAPVITADEYRMIRPDSAEEWPGASLAEPDFASESFDGELLAYKVEDQVGGPEVEPEAMEAAEDSVDARLAELVSGAALRRGLRDRAAEAPAEEEASEQAASGGGMLARLFRRR